MPNDDLKALIRTIADYPVPGVQFRDISTLLLDGPGFRATIDRLAALIDPARVSEAGADTGNGGWQALTDAVLDHIQDTPPVPGGHGVLIPGGPERQSRALAAERGITLDPDTVRALHDIGRALGLDVPAFLGP